MSFTLILQTRYHTRCTTNLKTQILSFLILLILCRLWMSASQQQLPDKKEKRCPHRTLVVSKLAPCQIWYQGAPNLGRAETFAWMSCVYNIYYIYIICICSYIVYAYVMYDIYVHICIHKYIYIYLYRWLYHDVYAPKTQEKDDSRDVRVFVCIKCVPNRFGNPP